MRTNMSRSLALPLLAITAALVVASCGGGGGGGGGGTVSPPPYTGPGGTITTGNNNNNQLPPTGIPGYNGRTPAIPPGIPPQGTSPNSSFDYGGFVRLVPISSSGLGTFVVSRFGGNEKLAVVTTNLDPVYRDFSPETTYGAPAVLPQTFWGFNANLTTSSPSLAFLPPEIRRIDIANAATKTSSAYGGVMPQARKLPVQVLIDRERDEKIRSGDRPDYNAVKTASVLSRGIVRTFRLVRASNSPPPVTKTGRGSNAQNLSYPRIYSWQDGRLVGIGNHCYVFLSTEINNGYPDSVKFTQARIDRLVNEFDNNIFVKTQDALAPVVTYQEHYIYLPPDRSLVLTDQDFDQNGNLLVTVPEIQDSALPQDKRIIIAILKNVSDRGAGFFVPTATPLNTTQGEQINMDNTSTVYLDPDIDFPPDSNDWSGAYAVLAHEFQHKINGDHLQTNRTWMNEGLSQLNIYINGYTIQSGHTTDILIGQIEDYFQNISMVSATCENLQAEVPNREFARYGARFMFFLYLMEHYPPGTIKKLYTNGIVNPIQNIEAATGEPFMYTYEKYLLCLFIDGANVDTSSDFAKDPMFPWYRFATFKTRGFVGLTTQQLTGVKTDRYPQDQSYYPVQVGPRIVVPWGCDYVQFENGNGNDLVLSVENDQNMLSFLLPVQKSVNPTTGEVTFSVAPGLNLP
jgi:hypothetical protein